MSWERWRRTSSGRAENQYLPAGYFLINLFVSLFLLKRRKDSALVEFYNAAVQNVLKTFRKFAGKSLWRRPPLAIILKLSSYLANGQSSEATKADVCFSRKEIHTQFHYIIDLIKTNGLLLNPLVKVPQINYRVGITTKFRFRKINFTEDKIRWNSKWIRFSSPHLILYTPFISIKPRNILSR